MSTDESTAVLTKILERLERLESKVDAMHGTYTTLAEKAPLIADAIATTAQAGWDMALDTGIDPLQVLEAGLPIATRAAQPASIELVGRLLDHQADLVFALDKADHLDKSFVGAGIDRAALADKGIALVVKGSSEASLAVVDRLLSRLDDVTFALDKLDAFDAKLAAAGLDRAALADRGITVAVQLAALANGPEMTSLLQDGALDPKTLDLASKASHALVEVRKGGSKPAGIGALLSAPFDADIQKFLGFGLEFAKKMGRILG